MVYCSTDKAYAYSGLTSSEVSTDLMEDFILDAEAEVDRFTHTTWWSVELAKTTATSGDTDSITVSTATWTDDAYAGDYVYIVEGTGVGDFKEIESNTSDTITIDGTFSDTPDNTTKFKIIHTGSPAIITESLDGDGTETLLLTKYPYQIVNSISVDGTSLTTSNVTQYKDAGMLKLGTSSSISRWSLKDQANVVNYVYGVTPVHRLVSKLCALYAARSAQTYQVGGTSDIPSTYSLPEGSISIGQAYVNIKGAIDEVNRMIKDVEGKIPRYRQVA